MPQDHIKSIRPLIQANNLSYQFDNGETLFRDISCTLTHRRVGLVGRNGVGKSMLTSLLIKQELPATGNVLLNAKTASYSQLPSELLTGDITIAQFLKLDLIIRAIEHIEQGECDTELFSLVGDNWTAKQDLEQQLISLELPADVHFRCQLLSGGQLARLRLWQLFTSDADLLVLDEPSNHLDSEGKHWLLNQINQYKGHILLISHDRLLLRKMDRIWELSTLGLTQYGGNFDFYTQQKQQEFLAIERQANSVTKQQKRLEVEAQKNREKFEQRAAKGMKERAKGGTPKIVLNQHRSKATAKVSNRMKNENGRRELLQEKASSLQARQEQLKEQKMYLSESNQRSKGLVSIVNGRLPFGNQQSINIQINSSMKLHLQGGNGSGKSTLLKAMLGRVEPTVGEWNINTPMVYLDQHFGLLKDDLSLIESVCTLCQGMQQSDSRTLLAGIGFRRDDVHRLVSQLSGGEKMKLAMLLISHQPEQPLLLLDEPDNHLDLDSKRILATALKQYEGAFILVSHDEDFIQESGVNNTLSL
ncbi:ATP-binding cassette domain-containing protein [Vibrio sp. ZSDE26]|uniref:ATP-binding cassette domain-containing protein n=1 Tax=Vibrio amylolyticus TaxID=2847292 RepID=A0A9X1XLY9_9VIBR|nr:ATP-binding cassette domain-containing protein [Vibrio amylolyticus]MCK6264675.1 ATP-binding cassette domain-containing protein [Vibrio amylolyticus]